MKKRTPSKSKKLADKWFSLWVRMKDADDNGITTCFTCGCKKHYKELHAGHYIPRNILTTRWDDRNVKPQCPGCNLYGGGKPDIFAIELMAMYNKDILYELHNLKNTIRPMKQYEFEEIAEVYKCKVKQLQANEDILEGRH